MMPEIDIGQLTDEQTSELAVRCLGALSLADKVQAVMNAFSDKEEREELQTWIQDAEGQEEDPDADL